MPDTRIPEGIEAQARENPQVSEYLDRHGLIMVFAARRRDEPRHFQRIGVGGKGYDVATRPVFPEHPARLNSRTLDPWRLDSEGPLGYAVLIRAHGRPEWVVLDDTFIADHEAGGPRNPALASVQAARLALT